MESFLPGQPSDMVEFVSCGTDGRALLVIKQLIGSLTVECRRESLYAVDSPKGRKYPCGKRHPAKSLLWVVFVIRDPWVLRVNLRLAWRRRAAPCGASVDPRLDLFRARCSGRGDIEVLR